MRVDYTHIPRYIQTCDMNCGSAFELGASRLPNYCTPPVCVLAVLGALAVWRQNTNKKIAFHVLPLSQCARKGRFRWFLTSLRRSARNFDGVVHRPSHLKKIASHHATSAPFTCTTSRTSPLAPSKTQERPAMLKILEEDQKSW